MWPRLTSCKGSPLHHRVCLCVSGQAATPASCTWAWQANWSSCQPLGSPSLPISMRRSRMSSVPWGSLSTSLARLPPVQAVELTEFLMASDEYLLLTLWLQPAGTGHVGLNQCYQNQAKCWHQSDTKATRFSFLLQFFLFPFGKTYIVDNAQTTICYIVAFHYLAFSLHFFFLPFSILLLFKLYNYFVCKLVYRHPFSLEKSLSVY